jgi:DNA-binding NarL/FixJ family response regulator
MRILIVDDHVLFREGLVALLDSQPDFEIVGEASTAEEAVCKAAQLKPQLVLLDVGLPDGSGLDALKGIMAECPETMVVMLTIHETDEVLFTAIRNGAKGFLLKNTPTPKLFASLRGLLRGEAALSRSMATRIVTEFSRLGRVQPNGDFGKEVETLTTREMEVLRMLAADASNREIANRLVISENTVKIHVHKILNKLQLPNRREAGRFARRVGLP